VRRRPCTAAGGERRQESFGERRAGTGEAKEREKNGG
jgi:hypothetical protein